MKKLIFLLFVALSFAYQVTDTKTYMQKIKLKNIEISLNIQMKNKYLNNLLKNITDIINLSKNICQQNSYDFYPEYDKNGNFRAYKANIKSFCKFSKNKINTFSEFLDKVKSKAKIKMNYIKLVPTDKEKAKTLKLLREKAYNEAQKNAAKLSVTLNKQCFVTQINFNSTSPRPVKIMYKTLSVNTPLPTQKNHIMLNVFYKIECY